MQCELAFLTEVTSGQVELFGLENVEQQSSQFSHRVCEAFSFYAISIASQITH